MKEKDTGKAEMEADTKPAEESLDSVLDKLNSAIKVSDCTDYAASGRTTIKDINQKSVDEEQNETSGETSQSKRESNFLQDYLEDRDAFSFLVLSGMKTPNPTPKTSVVGNPVNEGLFVGVVDNVERTISEERIEDDDISNGNAVQVNCLASGEISNDKDIQVNCLASEEIENNKDCQVNCSAKQRNRKNTVIDGVLTDSHVGHGESEGFTPSVNDPGIASVGQIADIASDSAQIGKDKQEGDSKTATQDNNRKQDLDLSDSDDTSIPDLEIVGETNQSKTELNNEIDDSQAVAKDSKIELSHQEKLCNTEEVKGNEATVGSENKEEVCEVYKQYLKNISSSPEEQDQNDIPRNFKEISENECDKVNGEIMDNANVGITSVDPTVNIALESDSICKNDQEGNSKTFTQDVHLKENLELSNVSDAAIPDLEIVENLNQNNTELNYELQLSKQESQETAEKQTSNDDASMEKKLVQESQVENDKLKDVDGNTDTEKETIINSVGSIKLDENKKAHKNSKSIKKKALRRDTKLLVPTNQGCNLDSTDDDQSGIKESNEISHTSPEEIQSKSQEELSEVKSENVEAISDNDKTACDIVINENIDIVETNNQEIPINQDESDKTNKSDEIVIENVAEITQSEKEADRKIQKAKVEEDISNNEVTEGANVSNSSSKELNKDSNGNKQEIKPTSDEIETITEKNSTKEEENTQGTSSNLCGRKTPEHADESNSLNKEKIIINDDNDEGTYSKHVDDTINTENIIKETSSPNVGENLETTPENKINTEQTSIKEEHKENINKESKNKDMSIENTTKSPSSLNNENKTKGSPSSTKKVNKNKIASEKGNSSPSSSKKDAPNDLKSPKHDVSPSVINKKVNNDQANNSRKPASLNKDGSEKCLPYKILELPPSNKEANIENKSSKAEEAQVSIDNTSKSDLDSIKASESPSLIRSSETKTNNDKPDGSMTIFEKTEDIDTLPNKETRSSSANKKDNTEEKKSTKSCQSPSSNKKDTKSSIGSPSWIKKKMTGSSTQNTDNKVSKKAIGSPSALKKGGIENSALKKDISSTSLHKNDDTAEKSPKKIDGVSSNSKKDKELKRNIKKNKDNDPVLKNTSSILNRGQKLFATKLSNEKQDNTTTPSQEEPVSFDDLPSNDHVEKSANKHRAEIPKGKRPPNRISWMAGKLERSNSQDQPKELLPPRRLSRSNSNLTKETKEFTTTLEKVKQDNDENTEEIQHDKIEAEVAVNIPEVKCETSNQDKTNSDSPNTKEKQINENKNNLKEEVANKNSLEENSKVLSSLNKSSEQAMGNHKEESNSESPINTGKEKQIKDDKPHLKEEVEIDKPIDECSKVSSCEALNESGVLSSSNNTQQEGVNVSDDTESNEEKKEDINQHFSHISKIKNGSIGMEEKLSKEIELFISFIANKTKEDQKTNEILTTKHFIDFIAKKNIENNTDDSTAEFIDFILNKEKENGHKDNHCFLMPDVKANKILDQISTNDDYINPKEDKKTDSAIKEKHQNVMEDYFVELGLLSSDDKTSQETVKELVKEQDSVCHSKEKKGSTINKSLPSETETPTKKEDHILSEKGEMCDNHLNSDDEDSISFEDCKSSIDDDMPDLEIVATDFTSDDDHFHDAEKGGNSNSNSALGNAFLDKMEILHVDNNLPLNDENYFFDDTGNIKEATSTQINVYDVLDAEVNQTPQCQKKIIKGEKLKQSKIGHKDAEMKEQKKDKIKRINSSDSDENISFDRIAKERPNSIVDSILLGNIIIPQNSSDNDVIDSDTHMETIFSGETSIDNVQKPKSQNEDEELLFKDCNNDRDQCTNTVHDTENSIVDNTNLSIVNVTETKHDQDINVENNNISGPVCSKSAIETNESSGNSITKLDLEQPNNVIIDHNIGNNVDTDKIKINTLEGCNTTTNVGLVNESLHSTDNRIQSSDESQGYDEQQTNRIKKNRVSCVVDTILASGSNLNLTMSNNYNISSNSTDEMCVTTDCTKKEQIYTNTETNSAILMDNSGDNSNTIENQNCDGGIEQSNQDTETSISISEEINTKNSRREDVQNVDTKLVVDDIVGYICSMSNKEPQENADNLISKTITGQSNDVITDQNIESDLNTIKNDASTNKDEITQNVNKKCDTNTSETAITIMDDSLVNEVLQSIANKNQNCDENLEYQDNDEERRMRIKKNRGSCLVDTIIASGTNLNIIMANDHSIIASHTDEPNQESEQNKSEKQTNSEKEAEKKESETNNNILIEAGEQESSVLNISEKPTKSEELETLVHRQEVCQAVLSEITEIVSNPTTRIPSRNSSRNESRDDVNLIGVGEVTSVMDSKKKSAVSALTGSGEISGDLTVDTEAHNSGQHSNILLATLNSGDNIVNAQTTEDSCTSDILHDSGLESSNSGSVESISAGDMFIGGNTTMVNHKIVSPTSSPEVIMKTNSKIQDRKSSSEVLQKNMTLLYENSKDGKERQNSIVDSILSNKAQNGEKQITNSLKNSSPNAMGPVNEVNDQTDKQFYKDESKTTNAAFDQSCELTEILPLCESMSLSEYMSLKTDETNKDHDEIILEMVQNSLKQLDFIELRYRGLNTALEEKQAKAVQKLNMAEENFQESKREYDHGLAMLSSELINTDSNEERLRGIELVLASEEDAAVKLDRIKMLVTYGTGNTGDKKKLKCSKAKRKHHHTTRRGTPANFWKRKTNQIAINTRTKTGNITDTKQKDEVTDSELLPQQSKLIKKTKMKKQIIRTSSKP